MRGFLLLIVAFVFAILSSQRSHVEAANNTLSESLSVDIPVLVGESGIDAMIAAPQLRVAAYNVLAQALAKSSYFPYTKGSTLKWKARFPLLQKTIDSLGADIMCLSEVDEIDQWREWLVGAGYESVFQQKPTKKWGSLIAWRRGSFELQHVAACDFNDVAVAVQQGILDPEKLSASEPHTSAHYARDGNGLVVTLRPSASSPFAAQLDGILVGATHLYWDPAATSVKAAQAAQFRLCMGETLAQAIASASTAAAVSAAAGNSIAGADSAVSSASGVPSPAPALGPAALQAAMARWAVFVGGDLNSFPRSAPVQLLRRVPVPVAFPAAAGAAEPVAAASPLASAPAPAHALPLVSSWSRWGRSSPPGMAPPPPHAASPTAAAPSPSPVPSDAAAIDSSGAAAAGGAGASSLAPAPQLHHWQPYGELSPQYAAWLQRLAHHCVAAIAEAAALTGGGDAPAPSAPADSSAAALPAAAPAPAPGYATLLLRSAYGVHGGQAAAAAADAAAADAAPASAADPHDDESFEPAFTTLVASFRGCIDYIMFGSQLLLQTDESSSASLSADGCGVGSSAVASAAAGAGRAVSSIVLPPRVLDVLPLPSEEAVTANGSVAMPNPIMPSDHAPLAATFQFV